jgi:transcriptional repressor NrdR
VIRTRKCKTCGHSFKTAERLDESSLTVQNRNGDLEPFERSKISDGIRAAGRGKPLLEHEIAPSVDRIVGKVHALVATGQHPVTTRQVGELVLEELRYVSPAAHIRFAAVFKGRLDREESGFATIDEFIDWVHSQYATLPETNLEKVITNPQTVVKNGLRQELFDRNKLKRGILIAVRGRRPERDKEEELTEKIAAIVEEDLRGQPFVRSGQIGAAVLGALESLGEEVGYIRFAIIFKQLRNPIDIWYEAKALQRRRTT